ncbi:MAG: DNA recombination protein RmuC [Bacteroidetes bacterium]|nr:DNA recombination protein RmuC [Bacteroidota bacterium]
MDSTTLLYFLLITIGLLLGSLITWLIMRIRLQANHLSKAQVNEQYILKEIHESLQQQTDVQKEDLIEKERDIRKLMQHLSVNEQKVNHLEEKMSTQKAEFENLQKRSRIEFENLANRILEEKTKSFTDKNQEQLYGILNPLKEKIKTFEESIEKRYWEESKDRFSLKKEIEHLKELNQQLSQDANNLVNALKGENKTQGDWGEFQLEMLLEKAGLNKDIHYLVQPSYKDENGKQKRPDFIINLPEEKHLIIDSKVSLVAYEKYFNSELEEDAQKHLKSHINSIRQHINDLSSKNYQQLYQINSPDYLLLFIPIEPAFSVAVREDSSLFTQALDKNIVIVTTSTLLATMRTVSYIWKQEKQKRSVQEIARQSGMLYDKFCAFVDDLKSIGSKLESVQTSYHQAMNKLTESKKFGDTLIGRAQKIKELGAKTSKSLPKELLE